MKYLVAICALIVGCADSNAAYERHCKAAWAIEGEAQRLIDAMVSVAPNDKLAEQIDEVNARLQDEIVQAQAAKASLPDSAPKETEIAIAEQEVASLKALMTIHAGVLKRYEDLAKSPDTSSDLAVDLSFKRLEAASKTLSLTADIKKAERRLELMKALYR